MTTPGTLLIRDARPGDAGLLSGIALASKAIGGYSDAFMAACEDELRVLPEHIPDERAGARP